MYKTFSLTCLMGGIPQNTQQRGNKFGVVGPSQPNLVVQELLPFCFNKLGFPFLWNDRVWIRVSSVQKSQKNKSSSGLELFQEINLIDD